MKIDIVGSSNYKNLEFAEEKYYFYRNKQIVKDSSILLAFINKSQYHSGAWNTIKHFTKKKRLSKLA